jgi:DNA-binding NarL/FixJ family response regulator
MRILVADRLTGTRKALCRRILQTEDMEVIGAVSSGTEAVQCVSILKPDIVLIDMSLSNPDGIDTIQKITSQQTLPAKVVVLSHTDQDIRPALMAGAKTCLIKPISDDELFSNIRHLFGED